MYHKISDTLRKKMRIKKIAACIVATAFAVQNLVSVKAVTPEDKDLIMIVQNIVCKQYIFL